MKQVQICPLENSLNTSNLVSKSCNTLYGNCIKSNIVFKWAIPGPLFNYFRLFKQTLQIFTTNICEKCPSSIRCWDSNPHPSEHESPPIRHYTRAPAHRNWFWYTIGQCDKIARLFFNIWPFKTMQKLPNSLIYLSM